MPRSSSGLSDRQASGASAASASGHALAERPRTASFPVLASTQRVRNNSSVTSWSIGVISSGSHTA
eukprot:3581326-Pyramimonas_sp.AAC.1